MKNLASIAALSLALSALPAIAHHAAEDILDEEVFAMIDDLVADTPHAEMTLDDLGGGMTETTIEARTVRSMEEMIDDGLLTYSSMLDGQVEVAVRFNDDGSATVSVTQMP